LGVKFAISGGSGGVQVVAAGTGTQTLTNTAGGDQDFTPSLYTIPANVLTASKVFRVSILFNKNVAVGGINTYDYLKLNTVQVFNATAASFAVLAVNRSYVVQYYIFGRGVASATATICCTNVSQPNAGTINTISQPVAVATNVAIAITAGINYSGGGGGSQWTLLNWCVEELN
jgi:hypothetical protein